MSAQHTPGPVYPQPWSKEMQRNPSGRRFWCVSRFVTRTRCEYVSDIEGVPIWFNNEPAADAALAKAASCGDVDSRGRPLVTFREGGTP